MVDYTDPFTQALLQSTQGVGGGRGLDTGLVRGEALYNAQQQTNRLQQASGLISNLMKQGMPANQAIVSAFQSDPLIMAEHPELFQSAAALRQLMLPQTMEQDPNKVLLDATNPGAAPLYTPGQGVPNAGQLTFQTGTDGQVYAIAHDMSGRPISVTNQTETEGREGLTAAQTNAANSEVPRNQAQAAAAQANAAYLKGRTELFTGLNLGMNNAVAPQDRVTPQDLAAAKIPPETIQQLPALSQLPKQLLSNPEFAYALNIATYRQAPPSPYAQSRPDSTGTIAMQIVHQLNPGYDETQWLQKKHIVDDYASTGSNNAGGRIMRFNAVANHLTLLQPAIQALGNGDVQKFNQFSQQIAQETGSPAPTNLQMIGQIVSQEVQNAIQGNRSGEAERLATAAQAANKAASPAQLEGVVEDLKGFLRGQFGALEQQYSLTGLKGFRSRLVPNAQAIVNSGTSPQSSVGAMSPENGPSIPAPPSGFTVVQ